MTHPITDFIPASPRMLEVIDVDADLDLDLIVASELAIEWFENDGQQLFVSRPILTNGLPRHMQVIDVDGDLDPDVLSASRAAHRIALHLNDGNGQFTQLDIRNNTSDAMNPVSALAEDMDGDGDLDLVLTSQFGNAFHLLEQTDPLQFDNRLIGAGANAVMTIVADLDGDASPDVVFANLFNGQIEWLRQNASGQFTRAALALDAPVPNPVSIRAVDPDQDGDADLLVTRSDEDRFEFLLLHNDGAAQFSVQSLRVLEAPFASNRHVDPFDVHDLNGDGALDVLAASFFEEAYLWFRALLPDALYQDGFESPPS